MAGRTSEHALQANYTSENPILLTRRSVSNDVLRVCAWTSHDLIEPNSQSRPREAYLMDRITQNSVETQLKMFCVFRLASKGSTVRIHHGADLFTALISCALTLTSRSLAKGHIPASMSQLCRLFWIWTSENVPPSRHFGTLQTLASFCSAFSFTTQIALDCDVLDAELAHGDAAVTAGLSP
jgi:hypothetical protein